jgi:hypothetical protein
MRIVLLLLPLLIFGCSDDRYTERQLYNIAVKVEPGIKIILPKSMDEGVKCEVYKTAGCIGGKMARLRKVIITLVEFETEEQAKEAAIKIDQYHIKNWVLDDVVDEPVLESFVAQAFPKAVRPYQEHLKKMKKKGKN